MPAGLMVDFAGITFVTGFWSGRVVRSSGQRAEASCVQVSMPMPGQAVLGSLPTELSYTEAGGVVLRAGLKRFFFNTFQNPNGSFFRITEVRSCHCAHKALGMIAANIVSLWCFLRIGVANSSQVKTCLLSHNSAKMDRKDRDVPDVSIVIHKILLCADQLAGFLLAFSVVRHNAGC